MLLSDSIFKGVNYERDAPCNNIPQKFEHLIHMTISYKYPISKAFLAYKYTWIDAMLSISHPTQWKSQPQWQSSACFWRSLVRLGVGGTGIHRHTLRIRSSRRWFQRPKESMESRRWPGWSGSTNDRANRGRTFSHSTVNFNKMSSWIIKKPDVYFYH